MIPPRNASGEVTEDMSSLPTPQRLRFQMSYELESHVLEAWTKAMVYNFFLHHFFHLILYFFLFFQKANEN
jgi:hypothetical protein